MPLYNKNIQKHVSQNLISLTNFVHEKIKDPYYYYLLFIQDEIDFCL